MAELQPFRIAIVGGAIGGLTTVLFLQHFFSSLSNINIQIDVYEQAQQYREITNGVGLGLNAAKLLHRVGLGPALNRISAVRNNVWFQFVRWDNGQLITTVPLPHPKLNAEVASSGPDPKDDTVVRTSSFARNEYLDVVLERIRSEGLASLHTGKKLRHLEDLGDEIRIHFADDTLATANIVIAADGIHSAARRQLVPMSKALYSGKIAYRGVVPVSALPLTWPDFPGQPAIWVAKDKHFLVFPIRANKSVTIVAFVTKREDEIPDLKESWTSDCSRTELEDDFADFEETVKATIKLLPERVAKWRINDHEPVENWQFMGGKVVLVGDACHAMVPHQGAGAGQAVEDGYILSRALSDFIKEGRNTGRNLEQYMRLYQEVRLPRAQKVQQTSRDAGELYELQSPFFQGKSYDECLPLLSHTLQERMKWIWTDDIDAAYEEARAKV